MILRADDEAGDMRRCQTDEGDGITEGGNHSRKKTGDDEQNDAQTPDIEAQILGILVRLTAWRSAVLQGAETQPGQ